MLRNRSRRIYNSVKANFFSANVNEKARLADENAYPLPWGEEMGGHPEGSRENGGEGGREGERERERGGEQGSCLPETIMMSRSAGWAGSTRAEPAW